MQAHGTQKRASGDPFFAHPLEVAAHPDRPASSTTRPSSPPCCTTRSRTPTATLEEIDGDLRPRDRRAGRRPDQDQAARPRLEAGGAGRELPQAAARHRGGRPRAAGQARRPPAQHAHPPLHAAGEARCASPRRRSTSTRRSPAAWACRSCARSWRTSPSATSSRRPTRPSRSASPSSPSATSRLVDEIEKDLTRQARGAAASRPRSSGRQKRPYSIWRKMERKSVAFEQLSDIFGFRVIVETRRRLLPRARHRPHDLADGARAASRTTSRRRSRTTTARSTPP